MIKTAVEISMYPLKEDYEPSILRFIDSLKSNSKIHVQTNGMSTQLFGDFDEVFQQIQHSIKQTYLEEEKVVFNLKVLKNPLPADFKL